MPSDGAASPEVEVLTGSAQGGLDWVVTAHGDDDDLYTMLRVLAGDQVVVAGSGFGGPMLPPGSFMAEWRGRTNDLPFFVMARTAPTVDRVIATTDQGLDVELAMSAPIEQFGLRFAAAALPDGHQPHSIRAERHGTVVEVLGQPTPPPHSR
jgi:hypothetical protein